ncbi:hypothetical protein DPMN_140896 [Dreissena polymorpha]|uniref:Uncharacterized protein n=1 Tax=Dreissena polymorpha TaxID=45954 RepID=A0A9D4JKS6_DREPO|nr:hypothetical protein DPMN_140896 [Dreissena polymorpha]
MVEQKGICRCNIARNLRFPPSFGQWENVLAKTNTCLSLLGDDHQNFTSEIKVGFTLEITLEFRSEFTSEIKSDITWKTRWKSRWTSLGKHVGRHL